MKRSIAGVPSNLGTECRRHRSDGRDNPTFDHARRRYGHDRLAVNRESNLRRIPRCGSDAGKTKRPAAIQIPQLRDVADGIHALLHS